MAKDQSEQQAFARYRESQRNPKGMRGVKVNSSSPVASQTAPSPVSPAAPAPASPPQPIPLVKP